MKKFFLLIFIPLLLASCGTVDTSDTSLSLYEGNGFQLQIPKSWIKVDAASAPTPGNGQLEGAWSSTEIASGFANNLVILSEKLTKVITSKKYAIINYALSTGKYLEFTKLDEKSVTFTDSNGTKDDSELYIFEAKYNPQTPTRRFVQTSKVCGDTVYLMTVGVNLGVTDTKKYEDFLTSFQCTDKKTGK